MWTMRSLVASLMIAALAFAHADAASQERENSPEKEMKLTEWRGVPRPVRVPPVYTGVNRIERVPGLERKAAAREGKAAPRVALMVEHDVRLEIPDALTQFQDDLAADGYTTFVVDVWGGLPSFVRGSLQDAYAEAESLAGAILIGDISHIEYECMQTNNSGEWERETFPCDLYYMDMDGTWSDTLNDREVEAGNGFFDTWTESGGRSIDI